MANHVTLIDEALAESFQKLEVVWTAIGVEPASAQKELEGQVRALYQQALEDAERTRNQLQSDIVENEAASRRLREQLQLEDNHQVEPDSDHGLISKSKRVKAILDSLQRDYEKRLCEVQELLDQIAALETALGEQLSEHTQAKDDLTLSRREQLQSKLASLESAREKRVEDIHEAMSSLKALVVELDLGEDDEPLANDSDTQQLQVQAATGEFDMVGVHCDTLKNILGRVESLQKEKLRRQEMLKSLAVKITALWNRLNVAQAERHEFLNEHSGMGLTTIAACQGELERLEKLKALSLKELIARARYRLTALWDECMLSEEERFEFLPAFSDAFTDESLEAHDMKIREMEVKAEAMRPLLKLVSKRESLLDERRALERSSLDQNRFRIPGRLIQEEKTRKMLKKRLPIVEAKLTEGIAAWELEYGGFVVGGTRYLEIMSQQKENDEASRKQDWQARTRVSKGTPKHDSAALRSPGSRRMTMQPQVSSPMQRRSSMPAAAVADFPVPSSAVSRRDGAYMSTEKPDRSGRTPVQRSLRRPKTRPILVPMTNEHERRPSWQ